MNTSAVRSSNDEPDVRVELITPDRAREYLGCNTHNRNLRSAVVQSYAADMVAGDWLWNGESIKFDADGILVDGQHRLAAIVESDKAVRMLVIRDLGSRVQETVDGGVKRRFCDVLNLRGEKHYVTLATACRGVTLWETGGRYFSGGGQFTNAQMLATLEKYPWLREGMTTINRVARDSGLPARVGGVAWWLFMTIDPEDAEHFFERLCSDEDNHAGNPIFELRKSIARSFSTRGERSVVYLLAVTIKAWNKYRAGETAALLTFRPGGAKPEAFPEPK